MKSFNQYIIAENDKKTLADFDNQQQIIQTLKKDASIKRHIGKHSLYFDDGDLVYHDKTVKSDLLSSDGWDPDTTIGDLKKMILKMPKYK